MAIIIKEIIGNLQGSLTNFVIRNRNGKLVVYSKPLNQKIVNLKHQLKHEIISPLLWH